jgi:hypothetical protein
VLTESVVEEAVLAWLENLGYAVKHGPEIASGGISQTNGRPRSRYSGSRAGVSAKNATTQRKSNVRKMHIDLKLQDYGQGCCQNRGRQLVQKMHQFRWFVNQVTVSRKK